MDERRMSGIAQTQTTHTTTHTTPTRRPHDAHMTFSPIRWFDNDKDSSPAAEQLYIAELKAR